MPLQLQKFHDFPGIRKPAQGIFGGGIVSRTVTLREIDWGKEWLARKKAQDRTRGFNDGNFFWEDHQFVKRFSRMNTEDNRREIEERLAPMDIRPGDKVLDIGAGPGTLAIPLAKKGCKVTAVEPSDAMRKAFFEHAAREGPLISRWSRAAGKTSPLTCSLLRMMSR